MRYSEKESQVADLKAKLAEAHSLLAADYRGINVGDDTELRDEFRKNGCEYRVVKNTLLGLAVKGTAFEGITEQLKGPTAIAYSLEDAAAPAKVLVDFAKKIEALEIKGGLLDGNTLDVQGVEALSKMPGKDEMRATFLATLMAAPQTFVRLTTAAQTSFVHLLNAKQQQGE